MKKLMGLLIIACIIYTVINLGYRVLGIGVDTTDESRWCRSGLKLYTDHGTGVQYVSTKDGMLTPRLNADGSIHNTNDITK